MNMYRQLGLFIIGISLCLTNFITATPVVLWHGMGDSCCNPLSMGSIVNLIQKTLPGTYVHSLRIGNNVEEDTLNGFFMSVNDQISLACKLIREDGNLTNGYNAIGFSQGGQFLRAVAQRCPSPPMRNLVSIGGQHQGVYGFPRCPTNVTGICDEIRRLLNFGAYEAIVQKHLVQAQYWHDPLQETEYRQKSAFLADINQELSFNPDYKENILKLKNLVLVQFLKDTMVIPHESEWFGFYKPGQSKQLYELESSPLYLNVILFPKNFGLTLKLFYKKDTLGLQTLDQNGRLFKLSVNADHLRFTDEWFVENIVNGFLKD